MLRQNRIGKTGWVIGGFCATRAWVCICQDISSGEKVARQSLVAGIAPMGRVASEAADLGHDPWKGRYRDAEHPVAAGRIERHGRGHHALDRPQGRVNLGDKREGVHTERPKEDRWNSSSTTIGKFLTLAPEIPLLPHLHGVFGWMKPFITDQVMGDHRVKEKAVAAYRADNRKVCEVIPTDRLRVFSVAEGRGPRCAFVGVPVPGVSFARPNLRQDFRERLGGEPGVAGEAAA